MAHSDQDARKVVLLPNRIWGGDAQTVIPIDSAGLLREIGLNPGEMIDVTQFGHSHHFYQVEVPPLWQISEVKNDTEWSIKLISPNQKVTVNFEMKPTVGSLVYISLQIN